MQTPADGNMVEVRDVVTRFGERVVHDGVNLEVPHGKVSAIVGGSGSGKSTMLRCIAGLELIEEGEIRIEGTLVQQARAGHRNRGVLKAGQSIRREIGMVFQHFNLFPHMPEDQDTQDR